MNILIPMAGLGSRFEGSRFIGPKFLIDICGKPMIQRAIEAFTSKVENARFLFVLRRTKDIDRIVNILENVCANLRIKIVDEITSGPTDTCLAMKEYINNQEELIIANCDQIMFWDFKKFLHCVRYPDVDGAIVTYTSTTPKNSYAEIDQRGNVKRIKEKVVISDISLNGIHYWKHGRDFVESAMEMMENKDTAPNGEFYVGPTYNYLINNGKNISIYHVANFQHNAVGVPDDLEKFLRKYYESL
jgi:dTDP-glucose pyrophosphorylase